MEENCVAERIYDQMELLKHHNIHQEHELLSGGVLFFQIIEI